MYYVHYSSFVVTRRRVGTAGAAMPAGEVSFVDFLLTIPVYPDDPRYSCLMKRNPPNEPAGPETSLWISVLYAQLV